MPHEDGTPKQLPERTGRHVCILCLGEVPDAQYFANDHLCDDCAAKDEYPLKTTPNSKTNE